MKHTNQRGIYLRHPSLSRFKKKKKKKRKETRWAPKLLVLSSISVREDFLEAELTKPYAVSPRQEGIRYSFICLFIHLFPAFLQKGLEVGHSKNTYIVWQLFFFFLIKRKVGKLGMEVGALCFWTFNSRKSSVRPCAKHCARPCWSEKSHPALFSTVRNL